MKRPVLALIFIALAYVAARGQEADTLAFLSMKEVRQQHVWLSAENPAGLSLNRFRSFSVAQAGYAYQKEDFGIMGRPTSKDTYTVSAESFQRFGNASLYGLISYALHNNRQQSWNSMSGRQWSPVNLADSLPGRQRAEEYNLSGGISHPVGRQWTVGAQFDYQVQLTAKDTDPRNRNQWMEWQLTPGASYRYGNLHLGASLLYAVSKESVSIRNMGAHTVYPIFAAYPLAFYRTLPQEGEVNWNYRSRRMGAALQADLSRGSFQLFQQFDASFVHQQVESNRIQNRSEGEADGWQAGYKVILQRQLNYTLHEWNGEVTLRYTRNYDPLQRQPDGGLWQTYGRVLRSTRQEADASLTYRFRRMHDVRHPRYTVAASVHYHRAVSSLFFYPTEYSQPTYRIDARTTFCRHIRLPHNAQLDLSFCLQGGSGGGTLLRESLAPTGQGTPDIPLWQNNLLRQQNFAYETGLRWALHPAVGYTRPFTGNAGSWFIRLTGSYERIHNLPCPNGEEVVAQIGWLF